MKTFTFKICKYTITVTIEKKQYKMVDKDPAEEIKMEADYDSHIWFSDLCEGYIEFQKGILAQATLDGYRNIVKNHLDGLMSCDVDEVCETCIQDAFDREIEKGLSVKTLKSYRTFVLKVIDAHYDSTFKPEIRVEKEIVDENA